MSSRSGPASDLSGFLDGIRARNLAAIERNTALQVSELQIRLLVLQKSLDDTPSTAAVAAQIGAIAAELRDATRNIDVRLVDVGARLRDVLLRDKAVFVEDSSSREHIEWVIRRYVEAAEVAHHEKLTDAALALGAAWREVSG